MIIIGSRQSGKTTRLLKDALTELKENPQNKVCIVSFYGSDLKEKMIGILNENRDEYSSIESIEERITFSSKMLPNMINFVDEFDLIPGDKIFPDEKSNYYGTLRGRLISERFQSLLESTREK